MPQSLWTSGYWTRKCTLYYMKTMEGLWTWSFKWRRQLSNRENLLVARSTSNIDVAQREPLKKVTIWNHRNKLLFNEGTIQECSTLLELAYWMWLKGRAKGFHFSFYEWISEPIVCIRSVVNLINWICSCVDSPLVPSRGDLII